ncbi:MAG: peptide chain release factor N(5)-glutamine methyltransferase [Bacteroidales bacterium]|nr:peptide chain release factor N(5)-glutamine methyltransferase [Bacteroidales bacterium]
MIVDEYIAALRRRLESLYPAEESRAIALKAVSAALAWDVSRIYSHGDAKLTAEQVASLDRMAADLENGRPLQYVLGFTEFAGLRIKVKEGCLIPRPETEQMFELAADEVEKNLSGSDREQYNMLDMCTGSGCLAYAFASEFSGVQVYGCDISDEALKIACKQRVKECEVRPVFFKADVLENPPQGLPKFDLIISNPPYIMNKEKENMRRNVLDYEPEIALFVDDGDPLVFYRAIKNWAASLLSENGMLWMEVNENLASQVAELFEGAQIVKDFNDKDRFVYVKQD